jgi:hypothetical protein
MSGFAVGRSADLAADLHLFMCPEVDAEGTQRLRRDPLALRSYPSRLTIACDTEAGLVSLWSRHSGQFQTVPIDEARVRSIYWTPRGRRMVDLLAQLDGRVRGFYVANMHDGSPFDADIYLGHGASILQYNRQRGNRSVVLWRLRHYMDPETSMGGIFQKGVPDTQPFLDKQPKIFWRGAVHGQTWANRDKASSLRGAWGSATDADGIAALGPQYSRVAAVLFGQANPDIADCAFVSMNPEDDFSPTHPGAKLFAPKLRPDEQLGYRYLLCPCGIDVGSQLYWAVQTNCLAFKEEGPYEVLPDYFLRPWIHYVPIAPGLTDLREKFEYCQAHPKICQAIVSRAQEAYVRMNDPKPWRDAEDIVLDRLGIRA